MKTLLSKKQVKAYRLVSGEFEGLSTAVAAERMGISPQALNRLLKRAEEICPTIFPILTKQENDVATALRLGCKKYEMANKLGVSLSRVSQIIGSLADKRGAAVYSPPIKMVRYENYLDSQIKERF